MSNAQRTLLQIINQAQLELGLPQDVSIFSAGSGNSSAASLTGQQMLGCLQKITEEMRDMAEGGWTALQTEFNLVVSLPVTTTGDIVINTATIKNIAAGTAGLSANNWMVSGGAISGGGGIPQAARIKSVDSPTQVTMTMEATGTATGAAVVFAQDTYALPSDFHHYVGRTWWDRTNRWELLGPDSPQMDQWHRSGIVATGPRRHWRQLGRAGGNQWRLWPPPAEIAAPLQLVYEYISTDCVNVSGAGASTSAVWANDTDLPYLDDRALIDGLKWNFWEIKGFNFIAKKNDWLDLVDRLIARDGGSQTLQLAKRQHPIFISPANVQDGFFPGPVGPNSS